MTELLRSRASVESVCERAVYGTWVVARDVGDFEASGVSLVNPWD